MPECDLLVITTAIGLPPLDIKLHQPRQPGCLLLVLLTLLALLLL